MSSESSPRPANEEEVFRFATPERFAKYQTSGGNSNSMIDHYYDKLLSVARPPPEIVQNSFLEAAALQSAAPLVKVRTTTPVNVCVSAFKHGLILPSFSANVTHLLEILGSHSFVSLLSFLPLLLLLSEISVHTLFRSRCAFNLLRLVRFLLRRSKPWP